MLELGDKKISELYLGEKKVSEVYLGEKNIRPVGWGYTPTATTLAYYPFKEDKLDKTGNTSLSVPNSSKWTIWREFNSLTRYAPKVSAKFASYRFKPSIVNVSTFLSVWVIEEGYTSFLMGHSDVNGFANSVQTYDGTNWHKVKLNLEANKWYHLAYGNDGEKTVVYVNGEQKIVRNWPPVPFPWYDPILTQGSAEFVDFILESKARTPEEVKAYYNETRGVFDQASRLYYKQFKDKKWNGEYENTGVAFSRGSFTISMWAKSDRNYKRSDGTWATLIWKYRWWGGWLKEAFILWVSCREHDNQQVWIWMRDLWGVVTSDHIEHTRMDIGQWHHIVVSYDARTSQLRLVTDGTIKHTETRNFVDYGNHPFYIWAMNNRNWPANYFYGNIEEVILDSRARTPEEVQAYYNQTKWQFWL